MTVFHYLTIYCAFQSHVQSMDVNGAAEKVVRATGAGGAGAVLRSKQSGPPGGGGGPWPRARASTAGGRVRCSTGRTRAASVSAVSPGRMGPGHWATIDPSS